MNARKYHRSSTLAFPKTREYAESVTRYANPACADRCVMYTCAFAVLFLAVILIVEAVA